MCIVTYKELQPYVLEFVRLLERAFEAGKTKGEEAIMTECLIKLLDCTETEDS